MEAFIIPAPDNPSRADLRSMLGVLGLMAGNVPGAAEQYEAVQTLMRVLYPRQTGLVGRPDGRGGTPKAGRNGRRTGQRGGAGGGSAGGVGRKRGPVTAAECRAFCEACGGPNKPACRSCAGCGGSGWSATLLAAVPEVPRDVAGRSIMPKRARGDFADQFGVSDAVPMPGTPHERGYASGANLVGSDEREDECREAANVWRRPKCGQAGHGHGNGGCDAADLSAAMEGQAVSAMHNPDAELSPIRPTKGRRLVKRLTREAGADKMARSARHARRESFQRIPLLDCTGTAVVLDGRQIMAYAKPLRVCDIDLDAADFAERQVAKRAAFEASKAAAAMEKHARQVQKIKDRIRKRMERLGVPIEV